MARFYIRVNDQTATEIQRVASRLGYGSSAAFIRQAVTNELRSGGSALQELEQRVAASLERLSREVRRLQTAQQAEYALLDAFVRVFLMCVPEPGGEAVRPAKARAAVRYGNLVKNVARNMTGDGRRALEELIGDD